MCTLHRCMYIPKWRRIIHATICYNNQENLVLLSIWRLVTLCVDDKPVSGWLPNKSETSTITAAILSSLINTIMCIIKFTGCKYTSYVWNNVVFQIFYFMEYVINKRCKCGEIINQDLSRKLKMSGEVLCKHCKKACWLLDSPCDQVGPGMKIFRDLLD